MKDFFDIIKKQMTTEVGVAPPRGNETPLIVLTATLGVKASEYFSEEEAHRSWGGRAFLEGEVKHRLMEYMYGNQSEEYAKLRGRLMGGGQDMSRTEWVALIETLDTLFWNPIKN